MPTVKQIMIAWFLVVVLPVASQAAPVTFFYKFTVDSVAIDSENLFASNSIGVGSMFTGSVTYDDTVTNDPFMSSIGSDFWTVSSLTFPIGTVSGPGIEAVSNGTNDIWQVVADLTLPGQASTTFGRFGFSVSGDFGYNSGAPIDVGPGVGRPVLPAPTSTGFTGVLSFAGNIPLFPGSSSFFQGVVGDARGTVQISNTPFVAVIPLPAGLPLLAAGLGVFAFVARRRVFSRDTVVNI